MMSSHLKVSFAASIWTHAMLMGLIWYQSSESPSITPPSEPVLRGTISFVDIAVDDPITISDQASSLPLEALASPVDEEPPPPPQQQFTEFPPLPISDPEAQSILTELAQTAETKPVAIQEPPQIISESPTTIPQAASDPAVTSPQTSTTQPSSETSRSAAGHGLNIGATYLFNPKPSYPKRARKENQQGLVLLNALISSNGIPQAIQIRESSGFSLLDAAAIRAVQAWRFVPAQTDGQPIDSMAEIPIRFTLKNYIDPVESLPGVPK